MEETGEIIDKGCFAHGNRMAKIDAIIICILMKTCDLHSHCVHIHRGIKHSHCMQKKWSLHWTKFTGNIVPGAKGCISGKPLLIQHMGKHRPGANGCINGKFYNVKNCRQIAIKSNMLLTLMSKAIQNEQKGD